MSRNNTPSVLSSLNAYDSTDSEDEERDDGEVGSSDEKNIKGVVDILLNPVVTAPRSSFHQYLAPPLVQPGGGRGSAPSSKEPSPSSSSLKKVGGTPTLLLGSRYAEEDEDNFDFCPPPMEEDDIVEEEDEEESAASGSDNNLNDQDSSSNNAAVSSLRGNNDDDDDDGTPCSPKRSKLVDTLLPPAPTTECDPALQAKFNKMMVLKSKGRNVNDIVQNMKSFRNPSIYNKLILLCNIDENGTNFPDQPVFGESSYYDELDKAQR